MEKQRKPRKPYRRWGARPVKVYGGLMPMMVQFHPGARQKIRRLFMECLYDEVQRLESKLSLCKCGASQSGPAPH